MTTFASPHRGLLATGIILTGLAVAAGAIGSHVVQIHFPQGASTFETALRYHMLTAIGLVLLGALAGHTRVLIRKLVAGLLIAGIVLFSGLLYLKTFAVIGSGGPLVPAGGLAMIAGWLLWGISMLWPVSHNRSVEGGRQIAGE